MQVLPRVHPSAAGIWQTGPCRTKKWVAGEETSDTWAEIATFSGVAGNTTPTVTKVCHFRRALGIRRPVPQGLDGASAHYIDAGQVCQGKRPLRFADICRPLRYQNATQKAGRLRAAPAKGRVALRDPNCAPSRGATPHGTHLRVAVCGGPTSF